MSDDPSDPRELLEHARQGEPAAFAELFARHREQVRQAVALRLDRRLAARVGVSDVLQETYLEASRRLADYLARPALPFDLWLRWLAGKGCRMNLSDPSCTLHPSAFFVGPYSTSCKDFCGATESGLQVMSKFPLPPRATSQLMYCEPTLEPPLPETFSVPCWA